jgi:protoporphyrin/coproporphyrin ferrochelatase
VSRSKTSTLTVSGQGWKPPADGALGVFPDGAFDAILVVSFGGPEGPDEVMPFLRSVTRGRGIPQERLAEVAHHYELFGGFSPINEQNRALIAALGAELRGHGIDLPVYLGNRNWRPTIADALGEMRDVGVRRALAIFTSAYSSYSGCRQYRENVAVAQQQVGEDAPEVLKVRAFYNHPGFVEANVDRARGALAELPPNAPVQIVFTAHSIPLPMARCCAYEQQLHETARLVAEAVGADDWALVYQSRSGPPQMPWLEPDICDHLETIASTGPHNVVVSPIGFISDHLEVAYDLDVEAAELATRLGVTMVRAGTAGTHPAFVASLRELVQERLTPGLPKRAAGRFGPYPDTCPPDCCRPGNGRPSPWEESPAR